MRLRMKNDAGALREVSAGFSLWGGLFTGMYLMYNGLMSKGLLYLVAAWSYQAMLFVPSCAIAMTDGPEKASTFYNFVMIPFIIPHVLFFFKANKWIVRHFLDKGYKPIGPGWEEWATKYGIELN